MKLRFNGMLCLCAGVFALAAHQLMQQPRLYAPDAIVMRLPIPIQIMAAGGDRHLAANIAAARPVLADYQRLNENEYVVLAAIQEDVSWMNPAHEDNYYLAGTMLAWQGQLDAAQRILQRAIPARRNDFMPGFLYAFNEYHFHGDPLAAARSLQASADGLSNAEDRLTMQSLAALWLEQGVRLEAAVAVMDLLIAQAHDDDFAAYLRERRAAMLATPKGRRQ